MDRAHPGDAAPAGSLAPASTETGPIELRVPAAVEHLFLVRLVADGVATRADFDLDELADLRMAVDETAARLIRRALPGCALDCRFEVHGPELSARLTTGTATGDEPTNTFEWHVLRTLTDTITTWSKPQPDGTFLTVVEFSKISQAAPA